MIAHAEQIASDGSVALFDLPRSVFEATARIGSSFPFGEAPGLQDSRIWDFFISSTFLLDAEALHWLDTYNSLMFA